MNGALNRAPAPELNLKRSLGLGAMIAILFFSVSGGPYGLEAAIGDAGAGVGILLVVLVPFLWGLPAALVVSELGTMMPVEGGYYHWVKTSVGPFWGFAEAWWTWVVSWVDLAIYPVLFVGYLEYWFPSMEGNRWATWALAVAVTWLFAIVNILGVKVVGDSSKLFLVIVMAPFVLITVIGLFKMTHNPFTPMTNSGQGLLPAFGAGLFVVMWNYSGFDALSTYGAEIENPHRDIPKAVFRSIPIVLATYLIPLVIALAAVGVGGRNGVLWEDGDFSKVAEVIGGPWLAHLLTAAALFSAVGLYSAWLLSYSRLPFALSEDGFLPHSVARISPRFGTPVVAIIISAVICTVFVWSSFGDLIAIDVTIDSFAILLEFVALDRDAQEVPHRGTALPDTRRVAGARSPDHPDRRCPGRRHLVPGAGRRVLAGARLARHRHGDRVAVLAAPSVQTSQRPRRDLRPRRHAHRSGRTARHECVRPDAVLSTTAAGPTRPRRTGRSDPVRGARRRARRHGSRRRPWIGPR